MTNSVILDTTIYMMNVIRQDMNEITFSLNCFPLPLNSSKDSGP